MLGDRKGLNSWRLHTKQQRMLTRLPFNPRQITDKRDTTTCIFCSCDNLERMTLINEVDLDILQMYLHTENELSRSKL